MHLMKVQYWVILLALALTAGCSSSSSAKKQTPSDYAYSNRWADRNKTNDLPPTGHLIEPEEAAELGYRLNWASPIELLEDQTITSVTSLGDIIITVEDPQNIVTALNASNGELLWKVYIGSELETLYTPSRDGDQIFIHSGTRFFTLDRRNGEVKAVARLAASVASPASYSPDTRLAIMSGSDGMLFAHSVDNNFARWRYRLAERITSSALLVGQDVFAVDAGGTYAMVEGKDGRPIWRNHTIGSVKTTATLVGSDILLASTDGKLYSVNRSTGQDTWQYLGAEQPLTASPLALGRLIIQPLTPNPGLIAIDAIDGKELWRNDISASFVTSRKTDALFFSADKLIAINLETGEVDQQVNTLSLANVVPLDNEGSLLLVGPTGRMLRLNPQ